MNIEKVKQTMMEEVERLSKEKYVLAVGLFGSFRKGKFSRFSDVDLFIITNRKERWRHHKVINGIEFEEMFNPYRYVEKQLKDGDEDHCRSIWETKFFIPIGTGKGFHHYGRIIKTLKPIKDRNKKIDNLKRIVENYRPSKKSIGWARYGIQNNLQKIQSRFERKEDIEARIFCFKLAEEIVHAWYMINKILSGNITKIFEDIGLFRIRPDNFEKELKRLFLGNADKAELIETAKKLSEETLKKLGGHLPQNIIMGKEKVL